MPGKRVLLVDYDPKNLTHTRELLEGAGFDVSTCGDGLAALDQFKSLSPDLVLLSAMLPKMHGFEVCSSIRKLPGGDKTPVVIITDVYKGKRYRVDAINKYGATEYIERPIEDANLVSILTGLVKKNGGGGDASPKQVPVEEKTVQFKRDDLMARMKDDAAIIKPKNVSDKPRSRDDMEKRLEQSLAGLDLEIGRKAKPKPKPAEPAKAAVPPKPAEPTRVAEAPKLAPTPIPVAVAVAESAGPTVVIGKAEAGGSTFTSEDLFTDVIASVERELQSGKVEVPKVAPPPPPPPPPKPVAAAPPPPPPVAPTPTLLKPVAAAPAQPQQAPAPAPAPPPPKPVAAAPPAPAPAAPPVPTPTVVIPKTELVKPLEPPKVAEPPKKAISDIDKKVSSTLSGLRKDRSKAEAPAVAKPSPVAAKPAAVAPPPPKAPEPAKKAEPPKRPEPQQVAEPVKAPAPAAAAAHAAPAAAVIQEAKPVAVPAPAPAARPVTTPGAAAKAEEGINFGQYLLLGKIATGGMAELYKAKRKGVEGFEKILAIKKILPHMSDNEEFITMFIDEAKLAAQLTHHNVCQIFDLGKIEGFYYIAMEYVHGKDLRAVLKAARSKENPIPVELAILIISKICSALDYAHRKRDASGQPLNLVHRDVSPQNILISYEGEVKLVDFGIAKAATKVHVTQHGALKGKLLYMSPEQAWGRSVDRRTDLFSLGVVLYELLTGRPLFFDENDTEVTILEKVREARVIPVREINQKVPAELEKIIAKVLKKSPEERYQVASEMQKDLDNLFYTEGYNATSGSLANYVRSLFPEDWGLEVGGVKDTVIIDKEALKTSQPAIPPPPAPPAAVRPPAPPPPQAVAPAPAPAQPKQEKPQPVAARPAEDVRVEPPAPRREPPAERPQPRAPELSIQPPTFRDISIPDIMAPQESKGFPKVAIIIGVLVIAIFVAAIFMFRNSGQQQQQQQQQTQPPTPTPSTTPPTTTPGQEKLPEATTTTPAVDTKAEELKKKIEEEQKKAEAQKATDETKKQQEARQKEEQARLQLEAQKQKELEKKPEPAAPPKEEKVAEVVPPPVSPQQEPPKEETKPPQQPATGEPEQPSVNEGDLVELGADVVKPEVINRVNPTYPPVAISKKIEGTVILSVLISENGSVLDVKVLRGIPGQTGLNEAATAAVKKWKFRPAVKTGKRVKVWMTYPIVFKLQ